MIDNHYPSKEDIKRLNLGIDKLTKAIEDLEDDIESTYVRKDVYAAEKRDIEKDLDALTKFKDWAIYLAIGLIISGMAGVIVSGGVPK